MDVIERLTKQGKDLGYDGETLQTFIKEHQIELRNERKAIGEFEREKANIEREKANIDHETCEAEAKIGPENREAEAKLERQKLEFMEKIEAQKHDAAREACEAETAKCEAGELLKRDELEMMERIERENMTLSVRKSMPQKRNVRKIGKRQKCNVRKIAKQLKGMINYFAIWKRQNWHWNKKE